MASNLSKFLFSTTIGRAVIVGSVISLIAFGAKLYWDEQTRPERERAKLTNAETLDLLVEAIEGYAEAHAKDERPFPQDTPWTPPQIDCGRTAEVTPEVAAHPTWKALGHTFKPKERYQLRFDATTTGYELLARADNDCDGVYEVLRRTGAVTVSGGVSSSSLKVDNSGD